VSTNPLPFLISGIVSGSVYGLAAMGLTLNYKVARVVNFAFGAIAMFCAYIYWQLRVDWGLPLPIALFGGIVIVPTVLALATEGFVYRKLAGSSVFARTAASIGLLVGFYGISLYLWNEPILVGTLQFPDLFPDYRLSLPGVNVNGQQIGIVVTVLILTLVVYLFLRVSRPGVQLRAVVVNPGLAELRGINAARVTRLGWAASYMVAAAAGILVAPLTRGDPLTMTLIVIYSLAAAALGGFVSLPLALVGGLILGLSNALLLAYAPTGAVYADLRTAVPFIFLCVVLIVRARQLSAAHDSGGKASILADLGSAAHRRRPALGQITGSAAVLLAVGAVFRAMGSGSTILVLSTGVGVSLVLLSYRMFTATTGMVSLAQGAFAGIGAFTAANLTVSAGWPWFVAVAGGAIVAAAAGALVALPTVRLRGVFLALATLAFAQLVNQVVFSKQSYTGGVFGKRIPRPTGFESSFSYFVLMVVAFWVLGYICERFQYSKTGMELQSDLSSSAGARSIGIRPEVGRLLAFTISAAVAAIAGAIMATQIQTVSVNTWGIIPALIWLTLVASGGVGSTAMMLQMGIFSALVPELVSIYFPEYQGASVAIFGLLALALLRVPGGLATIQDSLAHGIRRRLASIRNATDGGDAATAGPAETSYATSSAGAMSAPRTEQEV
jgi:branched-subunit amino acid ABC-type transport system permease component